MAGSSDSFDSAAASHRALRSIKQELDRHPIVTGTRGFRAGDFAKVVADLATERWGIDTDNPKLTARWFAGESQDARPEFSFHYSDTERDFGWHYHEQEHVEGWGHFQERTGTSTYSYESYTFPSQNPAGLVWDVMSNLSSRV
ncbi:MAG: hypothetical protein J07HQW1_03029 [Haloquadratum walsbyi J07HQW1]|uniref:Uncharacterized protein n=1 Tax=Haloquadratum walsbyi J07HQW1 TaxID=1238424 RepID=U1PL78_9EURY|nr:MAG: hypothetical protein J07HQW1_03029 [Haloquadratum walsbyi J07HQW1]